MPRKLNVEGLKDDPLLPPPQILKEIPPRENAEMIKLLTSLSEDQANELKMLLATMRGAALLSLDLVGRNHRDLVPPGCISFRHTGKWQLLEYGKWFLFPDHRKPSTFKIVRWHLRREYESGVDHEPKWELLEPIILPLLAKEQEIITKIDPIWRQWLPPGCSAFRRVGDIRYIKPMEWYFNGNWATIHCFKDMEMKDLSCVEYEALQPIGEKDAL